MTLSNAVIQAVRERAPFHDRTEQVVAREGGLLLRCDLHGAERLGCALSRLELVEEAAGALENSEVLARAERVCDKVTYLLEPLAPIEVDRIHGKVLVRSRVPKIEGDARAYYELVASADGRMSLCRYHYRPQERKRSLVDFALTGEQLALLVDDLVLAAGGRTN